MKKSNCHACHFLSPVAEGFEKHWKYKSSKKECLLYHVKYQLLGKIPCIFKAWFSVYYLQTIF